MAFILIVGAGLAGLAAAHELASHKGHQVTVAEMNDKVGGRLATRRLGDGVYDDGAQFFTVRTPDFQERTQDWINRGVAVEWCRGFAEEDGHPRYRGRNGMVSLAEDLARGVLIRSAAEVVAIALESRKWAVRLRDGEAIVADAMILTAPGERSLNLLRQGNAVFDSSDLATIESVKFDSCISLGVSLDGPSNVPYPGGVQLSDGPVRWVADNHQKGISPDAHVLTVHAAPDFSRAHLDDSDELVVSLLFEAVERFLGSTVVETHISRWSYSQPVSVREERCLVISRKPPLVLAGDAFGGPRVEGAYMSGLAAARAVLET